SAADCWAIGFYFNGTAPNNSQTLTEHWDGMSWSIVPSPNGGTQHNELDGVTCTSASNCWAVGSYGSGQNGTLIEHWNGTAWSIVSSPNIGTAQNYLGSVTCTSASDCWAVGNYGSGRTLIQHWDGTWWSIVSSPNQGSGNALT